MKVLIFICFRKYCPSRSLVRSHLNCFLSLARIGCLADPYRLGRRPDQHV